ncbi:MAG: exodeoxyribonuclease VII small subunit [Candidatus Zixiibacteriota bacterium]|nr:MAG: exodeoxyribonuclease VII small subunit [candidate division Zixibacteria bacterium]
MATGKKTYKDFETALERLEEITGQLESGESKLEESLALYSEGVEIAAFCSKALAEAEKKVTVLKERNKQLFEESFENGQAEDGE